MTEKNDVSRLMLAAVFCGAGALHFVRPEVYARIVPPPLPAQLTVALSGASEIAGGLGLLFPATRRTAGWGLVALLLAVWPANFWMALQANRFPHLPAWALWARLPLQAPLMWWAWRVSRISQGGHSSRDTAPHSASSLEP